MMIACVCQTMLNVLMTMLSPIPLGGTLMAAVKYTMSCGKVSWMADCDCTAFVPTGFVAKLVKPNLGLGLTVRSLNEKNVPEGVVNVLDICSAG